MFEIKPSFPQDKPLPHLRRDIKIYRGPDELDGSPTYNCLDPVKAQYYKISWAEFVILEHLRPGITLNELTADLNQHSTLKVTAEEVVGFFEEAGKNNLLDLRRSSEELDKEVIKRKKNPILWMMYNYLYIRVPLLNPDHFLAKTLPYVRPLVSRLAIWIYFILTMIGLVFLIDRFDEFIHTFPYFFNLQGVVIYALAITVVKIIHEFSHAYVAKFYRLHVPTMGVAFIVLWPVLYTDVTDGWKLNKRSQRIAISIAGVAAEVVLAGLSTFGWALSSPGILQSVFFVVSSLTWISTLLINLNPAMRFDGYYLFCDLIGMDNLQQRAFAFTRWQLRKWLLGLNVLPPEEPPSYKRRLLIIIYSIYTWIYRLVLYTVIAAFVYFKFTKVLGLFLFLTEIVFFIIPPFASEANQLMKLSRFFSWNKRSILTTAVFSLLLAWLILPFPHQEKFPALTIPLQDQIIYIPQEGQIDKINFSLGDSVQRGQVLMLLSSIPLEDQIRKTQADIEMVKAQIHVLSLSEEDKAFIPEKKAELKTYESKLKGLLEQKKQLTIAASINGFVYEKDDTLQVGRYLSRDQIVGRIAPLHHVEIVAFVPEAQLEDIALNQKVTFRVTNTKDEFKGDIIHISDAKTDNLIYPQLASLYKGELPVSEGRDKNLIMVESYFLIKVEIEKADRSLSLGERGYILARGPWKSYLMTFLRYVNSLYLRESGF